MAGASLAAEISPHCTVILIEAEAQPGYHSTGRSAAFWSETYGGPGIQPLTAASGPFLGNPPPDFHDRSFLSPRGSLTIAREDDLARLQSEQSVYSAQDVLLSWLDRPALERRIAGLKPDWLAGLLEPNCSDIDVGALHAAYLRSARAHGVSMLTDARVAGLGREGGSWRIETARGEIEAGIVVNAAGAWADEVAVMAGVPALRIVPHRRTIVQLRVDPPVSPDLPLVIDAGERFYFKPESGRLWLSPHDETPCPACDVRPEEIDIALAIDRLQSVVDWTVEHVDHSWAGLRSFAPDRLPVYGFAPTAEAFFWYAGQGGFGIQTAPAAAKLAAALLLGSSRDPLVAAIDPAIYSPDRFMN
jgi:D-arginine dehydrogenase